MKNLPNWCNITEQDYAWYILQGYEIIYGRSTCPGMSIYDQEEDSVCWLMDNKLHRLDGPAIIRSDGSQCWYVDGKRHRSDGPAIIRSGGRQCWYVDGKRHRSDGPAVIYTDIQEWWVDGKRHRSDGPAIICSDGRQYWYVDGKLVSVMVQGE